MCTLMHTYRFWSSYSSADREYARPHGQKLDFSVHLKRLLVLKEIFSVVYQTKMCIMKATMAAATPYFKASKVSFEKKIQGCLQAKKTSDFRNNFALYDVQRLPNPSPTGIFQALLYLAKPSREGKFLVQGCQGKVCHSLSLNLREVQGRTSYCSWPCASVLYFSSWHSRALYCGTSPFT